MPEVPADPEAEDSGDGFNYKIDRFADIQVLAYQVPGFDELSGQQKALLYYLYQAAYSGRDIMWDQNYKHNLRIRRTLEAVVRHYSGDRESEAFQQFMVYTRQVWFANGIHHHYSTLKFEPAFSPGDFADLVTSVADSGDLPLREGQDVSGLLAELSPILFDPTIAPKKVNTAQGADKLLTSAVNFYEGVTEAEVREFYAARSDKSDPTPISHGLNSKLVKNADGELEERVWKVGGMYTEALEQVVYWLEKAITVAENDRQRRALELLVKYYRSGDLEDFDAYSIAWVEDTDSRIDVINGFIEVYNDPIAYRGSFESVVSFRDEGDQQADRGDRGRGPVVRRQFPHYGCAQARPGAGNPGQGDNRGGGVRRRLSLHPHWNQPAQCQLDSRQPRLQVGQPVEYRGRL